ncbi:hypothetical protein SFUMM280S_08237 [Streptomyces fumanus]
MIVTLHHLLLDGWSLPILMRELWACYAAGGDAGALPAVVPYRDYAAWLAGRDRDAARRAWRSPRRRRGTHPRRPVDHLRLAGSTG